MEDRNFKFELLRLMYAQMGAIIMEDRFLTDYANGFKGAPKDERGLLDAGVSQTYFKSYVKAQTKDAPGTFTLEKSGCACNFNSNGNLTIQSPSGATQIAREDLLDLIAGIMKGAPSEMAQPTANPGGNVGTSMNSGGQNAYDHNPVLKRRMLDNLEAMEKFARASSTQYPKSK